MIFVVRHALHSTQNLALLQHRSATTDPSFSSPWSSHPNNATCPGPTMHLHICARRISLASCRPFGCCPRLSPPLPSPLQKLKDDTDVYQIFAILSMKPACFDQMPTGYWASLKFPQNHGRNHYNVHLQFF
jgi:hypothetical protein